MPHRPYRNAHRTWNNILIDDPPVQGCFAFLSTSFHDKVAAKLNELSALPLGASLLDEINNSGKQVLIRPSAAGNRCQSSGPNVFYRLRAAFRGSTTIDAGRELGDTLVLCAAQQWTLASIGNFLAGGNTPATVQTNNNLQHPQLVPRRAQNAQAIATLIEDVADGRQRYQALMAVDYQLQPVRAGAHSLGDDLLRFLRPWLRPGRGAVSTIYFNADLEVSCMGGARMEKRPIAIGLAHESCHAWRNVKGLRLFDDAISCGLDDDEVMTTGFPPYQYEKFSENLFRSIWRPQGLIWKTSVPMRQNYR